MQIVQNNLLFFHLYIFYHSGKLQGGVKEYEIRRNFKLCCMEFLNATNYDEGENLYLHESKNNIIVFRKYYLLLPLVKNNGTAIE
jgi:hypothetical protein